MEISKSQLATIQDVISKHCPKYKVDGYEQEDIQQEAFILAMECLKVWNEEKGPFQNFLTIYLSCRLKNLVRNIQWKASKFTSVHKAVMTAFDITELSVNDQENLVDRDNVIENVQNEELIQKIDAYLPIQLRRDFLRMKAGVKVNRGRANKIKMFISTLLKELAGEGEDGETE